MSSRVLITGASGFVGRQCCEAVQRAGWTVTGAVRAGRPVTLPPGVTASLCGDIGGHVQWPLEGVDAVIHLAARVHLMQDTAQDPLAEFRRVNVDGTRRLLEQSADAGVKRFVFLSSVKAVGEGGPEPYTESSSCHPGDPYGISKLEAEEVVREVGKERGIETVIIRPPVVYGPRVKANILRLMQIVSKGLPLPLGLVRNARSMVYVGNLVDAIRVAVEHPKAAGETFFVSDGEDVSTAELVRRLAHHLGKPARLVPVPVPLMRLGGTVLGKGAEVDRLVGSLTVDSSKIRNTLDWRPPFTMDEGLAEMAAWFRAQGTQS